MTVPLQQPLHLILRLFTELLFTQLIQHSLKMIRSSNLSGTRVPSFHFFGMHDQVIALSKPPKARHFPCQGNKLIQSKI